MHHGAGLKLSGCQEGHPAFKEYAKSVMQTTIYCGDH